MQKCKITVNIGLRKITILTDLKWDDILAIFGACTCGYFDVIQIVICDVKDVQGAAKKVVQVTKDFGFKGELLIARDFHKRTVALQHEEIFDAQDESEVKLSPIVPCDNTWVAAQLAPTFGSFEYYRKAQIPFLAMGHNFDASSHTRGICSCDEGYTKFTAMDFFKFENPPYTHNNRGAYAHGHEGGGYSAKQLQYLFDTYSSLASAKKFALSNTNYFKAKQTLKAMQKAGLSEKYSIPSEKAAFEAMIQEYKEKLMGDNTYYYKVLAEEVYPALFPGKPIPSWDAENECMVNPSKNSYLDRVFKQMMPDGPGDLLECTDGQQLGYLLRKGSVFYTGFITEDTSLGFNTFTASELSHMANCPQNLKRDDIDSLLDELVESDKKRRKGSSCVAM